MFVINEIYIEKYFSNGREMFAFIGGLRNARKFNLLQTVFFAIDNIIIPVKIVGIETTIEENSEFRYKVEIPEEYIKKYRNYNDKENPYEKIKRITLKCDHLFSTVEEAKQKAIESLDHLYNIQLKEIENFFSNKHF